MEQHDREGLEGLCRDGLRAPISQRRLNLLPNGRVRHELADLYFRRRPVQEKAFKEAAAALQLDKHRGNCGRRVANVAVITKLERIAARIEKARGALAKLRTEQEALTAAVRETGRADRKAQSKLATRRRRLDALIEGGKTSGAGFAKAALEHQQALVDAEATAAAAHKANTTNADARARADKLTKQTDALGEQQAHLEPQRKIRQLDVAQDQVLTATKLTANQLISCALRKYLKGYPKTPETFASRVFVVHGRKEIEPERERIVFYENPRDPEVTAALQDACKRLNRRKLHRDGCKLRRRHRAGAGDRAVRLI